MARANTHSFTIHAHKRVRKQKLEQVFYSKVGHILQQKNEAVLIGDYLKWFIL